MVCAAFKLRYPEIASVVQKERKKEEAVIVNSKNKFVMLTKFTSQLPLTSCCLSLTLL